MWLLVVLFADASVALPAPARAAADDVALYQQVLREHAPGVLLFEAPSSSLCERVLRDASDVEPTTLASFEARSRTLRRLPAVPGVARLSWLELARLGGGDRIDWDALRRAHPTASGIGWLSAIGWSRARTEAWLGLTVAGPSGYEHRCLRYARRGAGLLLTRAVRVAD